MALGKAVIGEKKKGLSPTWGNFQMKFPINIPLRMHKEFLKSTTKWTTQLKECGKIQ